MATAARQYERRDGISLARLHLDPENPRHDPIEDEDKIIGHLLRTEKVQALAKSIVENGGISPLDAIGVVEMADNPGHFIVAEGNRRTCALKVLNDPKKAPSTTAQEYFQSLAQRASLPQKFSVVVFPDKEAARPWMELRHLGPQDGAGMKSWNAVQKTRFARGASPDTLALAVLERAEAAGWIDAETRKKIGITTLTRYLGNPVVRTALGIGERGSLTFTHEPAEVDVALKKFVTDAIPRKDGTEAPVNSRTKAADWKAYGRQLHTEGISPTTALPGPVVPPAPAKIATPRPHGPRHPDKRPNVMPSDFVVKVKDPALLRLVAELKNIRPDDGFAFAANYLLRAVLERVMVLYAKKADVWKQNLDDRALTRACNTALETSGVDRNELKNLRIAFSTDDSPLSLQTLGAAVHAAHLPTRKSLIAVWDNWAPAVRHMLDQL
ncbi:MAG: ParB N-terminal domain-containing protein [Thiomonas delicata]